MTLKDGSALAFLDAHDERVVACYAVVGEVDVLAVLEEAAFRSINFRAYLGLFNGL